MSQPITNLPLFRQLLDQSPYDAVVALSPENFPFTAGCFIGTQSSLRDRLELTVWVKGEASPIAIICQPEVPQFTAETWIKDIRTYIEFHDSPIGKLVEVLKEKKLAEGNIGIELKYLTATYYTELLSKAPKARFSACEDLFYQARMIKTPAEIEILKKAGLATEKALLATYATIAEGESEKSMANRLAASMMQCGLDEVSFLYINAGPNTGYPHCTPSAYQTRRGDIIKSDVGGRYLGYPSDVARTAVVGKPTADQASIYSRLAEVHADSIAMARPGNRACDLFNASVKSYQAHDISFKLPHQGHGLGLEVHEKPLLTTFEQTVFQPSMVICIETRVRWVGKEGYHIEDLILITEKGPEVLTRYFDSQTLFEI
jgi:Xaa-Pro dipeptidase